MTMAMEMAMTGILIDFKNGDLRGGLWGVREG